MRDALDRLVDRWNLTVESEPIETFAGLVVFVDRDGRPAVLKIHGPRSDEQRSVDVLAHYGGVSSVRLLERDAEGLLIERAMPGTELAELVFAGEDDRATGIVADTIAALHKRPGLVAGLPTIAERGQSLEQFRRHGDDRRLDRTLVDRASQIHVRLVASQADPVVLHGDLHHYNILGSARGWLAIDPKGLIGEPAYEVGASLRNPAIVLDPAILDRRIAIFAERLGHDRQRIIGWCFAQAVFSAIWAIADDTNPDFAIACATATLPLLGPTT